MEICTVSTMRSKYCSIYTTCTHKGERIRRSYTIHHTPLYFVYQMTYLKEHVEREEHHGKVVHNQNGLELKGLSLCHDSWAHIAHEEVANTEEERGERRLH